MMRMLMKMMVVMVITITTNTNTNTKRLLEAQNLTSHEKEDGEVHSCAQGGKEAVLSFAQSLQPKCTLCPICTLCTICTLHYMHFALTLSTICTLHYLHPLHSPLFALCTICTIHYFHSLHYGLHAFSGRIQKSVCYNSQRVFWHCDVHSAQPPSHHLRWKESKGA